ncbi:MAG: hypothetical protein KKE81_03965 [Candidatus Omnitrophica bacterium]|nr:hypothetical protein [Candidatus Omnitrophota bacterium]
MNKKRLLSLIVVFILVQIASSGRVSQAQNAALSPSILVAEHYFKEVYAAVSVAIEAYKSDAIDGNTRKEIVSKYGGEIPGLGIRFDFNRTDMVKKGWTRNYPIVIHDERFIVRIFLTEERAYQPQLPVLFEMEIRDPAVTCQILADINSILSDENIEPYSISSERQVARSL